MERESFEDQEVADVLNRDFISIKVDREERPDIDSIYMNVCQAITGSGGWPLTVLLTPDKKPFYAGTYFPKRTMYGRIGLIDLLEQIAKQWEENRDKVLQSTDEIYRVIRNNANNERPGELSLDIIDKTYEELDSAFDKTYGGFGTAPKFPTPQNLLFLLRYWKIKENDKALNIVDKTLEGMYRGGLYDHIGFGFTRYSTDKKWLVPHFEKMLYDNALLAIAYIEGYLATGKVIYKEISKNIFEYILRDMRDPNGGFYTAEDADSEGVEGKFYVWDKEEVIEVLGKEDGEFFCDFYDISMKGNFEGKSIPNLINNKNTIDMQDDSLRNRIENLRLKLFKRREGRVHPYKDDKILTSWNGLMIAALAIGGRVFNDERYLKAAEKAVDFIFNNLINEEGRLLARYRDGEAKYLAYVDDYAFMTWALLEIFQSTGKNTYLKNAIKFNQDIKEYFLDENKGGLYLYGKDSEELIIRPKEIYDGAIPSGNSVTTLNFIRLSELVDSKEIGELAKTQFRTFAKRLEINPLGYTFMMLAFIHLNTPSEKIILVKGQDENEFNEIWNRLNNRFLPFTTRFYVNNDTRNSKDNLLDIGSYKEIDNKTTAYICKNFTCLPPENDKNTIIEIISKM